MKSFVVRIREEGGDSDSLRGVVDDVSTGARTAFHAGKELLDVLVAGITEQRGDAPGAHERPESAVPPGDGATD